jgi:uncharacterized membrane protein YbhN (UPF0104 family)
VTIDRRKALTGVILALLLAGAAFAVLGQVAHFGRLASAADRAQKGWLAVAVAGQLLAYLGYVVAYRDVARASGGPRFPLPMAIRIVVFGMGASVLGASVGGLAVDYWALRRTGTARSTATRRVLAVGTLEWTVLSLYAMAAGVAALILDVHVPVAMAIAWLAAVPACVAGALWFTSPKRVHRFVDDAPRRLQASGGRFRRALSWLEDRARAGFDNAVSGVVLVRHLISHPIRYRGGAIGYPIYWAGDILTLYAAVRAFAVPVNVVALILAYATSFVISALPLPAGGAGGIEAGMALALHAISVPLAAALVAVFVYRLITFWLPVIPALALLPSLRRLDRKLSHVPHTDPDADEGVSFRRAAKADTCAH